MKSGIIVAGICMCALLCGNVLGQTIVTNLQVKGTLYQSTLSSASGVWATALGKGTDASGNYSHAEGQYTTASVSSCHSEGYLTLSEGVAGHAEGHTTKAAGLASHAEGYSTWADASYSHAEGNTTEASGLASHAEGGGTLAEGDNSHAEGELTEALADNSHAGGVYSRVQTNHYNSFIHASGTSTNDMKETEYADTAHFDHIITLTNAWDDDQSVLSRSENDDRYLRSGTDITISGDIEVTGDGSFSGSLLVPEQGDIAMGSYTNGVQP